MYFFVNIKKHLRVPPEYLGPNMYDFINQKLNDLQGSCSIQYGYLVTIYQIESIENGVVNQFGEALFTVIFKALVFRPFRGEVLDGIVQGTDQVGIEIMVGALKIFVPHTKIPPNLVYNKNSEKYENVEDNKQIGKGTRLRFKIMSISIMGNEAVGEMSGIGSLEGDYLGLPR